MSLSETRSRILRTDDGPRLVLRRAFLLVEEGPEAGLEFELKERPVVIGRGETADLKLDDPTVSREHARLEPEGEGWRICDLGSKSGVRINGVQVEAASLEPGLPVQLGTSELVLRVDTADLAAPTPEKDLFEGILGRSKAIRELLGLIQRVGALDLPVLLHGETGTGKERLARALHSCGPEPDGPYVVVVCTLLGEGEHLRSELFGHVKGAFTGAERPREGAFQKAHGGTLFLDEVGELPLSLQPQLLRVLQEGEVRPLGGTQVHRVRTRVVAATNRDLEALAAEGRFREDLFFRLSAVTLEVPALRDRGQDVLLLAEHFLPDGIELDDGARGKLLRHPWPGNVRELEFALQQAVALCAGSTIGADDLRLRVPGEPSGLQAAVRTATAPMPAVPHPAGAATPAAGDGRNLLESQRERVARLEEEAILQALQQAGGNRNEAARILGISRATLFRRLKKMREEDGDE